MFTKYIFTTMLRRYGYKGLNSYRLSAFHYNLESAASIGSLKSSIEMSSSTGCEQIILNSTFHCAECPFRFVVFWFLITLLFCVTQYTSNCVFFCNKCIFPKLCMAVCVVECFFFASGLRFFFSSPWGPNSYHVQICLQTNNILIYRKNYLFKLLVVNIHKIKILWYLQTLG